MLVVNLFGGPGSGKSSVASLIFGHLKEASICAELSLEFAKDLVWEGRTAPFSCQPYIFGEQLWRLQRLEHGGVEVAITDCPLLLSSHYGGASTPKSFHHMVRDYHARFDNLNFVLERVKPFEPRGRIHSEEEAVEIDLDLRRMLGHLNEPFQTIPGNLKGALIAASAIKYEVGWQTK